MAGTAELVADEVGHDYGGAAVLSGINLRVRRGEWLALLGPNGSGKSTLLRILAGITRARRGRVLFEGQPMAAISGRRRGCGLAYLPQSSEAPAGMIVADMVRLGRVPHLGLLGREGQADRDAVAWALAMTESAAFATRELTELSGGERQRVELARALAVRPSYLLLDEPANHLDLHHQSRMLRLLRQLAADGVGVVSVLHDANHALAANRVALLAAGMLVAEGGPTEVLNAEVLGPVYEDDIRVRKTLDGSSIITAQW